MKKIKKIEDIKSYKDCCIVTGETPIDEDKLRLAGFLECEIALRKIKTACKAANILNNNWNADWSNPDQNKYYPYFIWRSSGFRYCVTYYTSTITCVGSRLCCGRSEDMLHIIKLFEKEFVTFLKGE